MLIYLTKEGGEGAQVASNYNRIYKVTERKCRDSCVAKMFVITSWTVSLHASTSFQNKTSNYICESCCCSLVASGYYGQWKMNGPWYSFDGFSHFWTTVLGLALLGVVTTTEANPLWSIQSLCTMTGGFNEYHGALLCPVLFTSMYVNVCTSKHLL